MDEPETVQVEYRLAGRFEDVALFSILSPEELERDVPFDKADRVITVEDAPGYYELWLVEKPRGRPHIVPLVARVPGTCRRKSSCSEEEARTGAECPLC